MNFENNSPENPSETNSVEAEIHQLWTDPEVVEFTGDDIDHRFLVVKEMIAGRRYDEALRASADSSQMISEDHPTYVEFCQAKELRDAYERDKLDG